MNKENPETWSIEEKLAQVMSRIMASAQRVRRDPSEVRLVAVSKSQSVAKIKEAYDLGLRDFGENRAHEALSKQEELTNLDEIRWHMIGHIQSRKTRYLVPNFSMIHSIDRMKIAERLDSHCGEIGLRLPVLLECNMSGEETKGGWDLADRENWSVVLPEFRKINDLSNLNVRGLMMMAPFGAENDVLRSVFKRLRELKEFLSEKLPASWDELSMGMTDDYEIAIEEGSTIVRIGRAIFGPRDYG